MVLMIKLSVFHFSRIKLRANIFFQFFLIFSHIIIMDFGENNIIIE